MRYPDKLNLNIPFPTWAKDSEVQDDRDFENWKELMRWADRLIIHVNSLSEAQWDQVAFVDAWGIHFDGTYWWVTEGVGRTVSQYDSSWTLISTFESHVGDIVRGICRLGSSVWVTGSGSASGADEEAVFQYSTAGVLLSSFVTGLGSTSGNAGLATDGTDLWVVDSSNSTVKEYSTSGVLQSSFTLPASSSYGGATYYDGHLWIIDDYGLTLTKYTTTGLLVKNVDVSNATSSPKGVWISPTGSLHISKDDVGVYQRRLLL